MDPMKTRYDRVNLIPNKEYYMIHQGRKTFVGTFVQSMYSGSGDGMTVSIEFLLNDRPYYIEEDMWGSESGEELTYFTLA